MLWAVQRLVYTLPRNQQNLLRQKAWLMPMWSSTSICGFLLPFPVFRSPSTTPSYARVLINALRVWSAIQWSFCANKKYMSVEFCCNELLWMFLEPEFAVVVEVDWVERREVSEMAVPQISSSHLSILISWNSSRAKCLLVFQSTTLCFVEPPALWWSRTKILQCLSYPQRTLEKSCRDLSYTYWHSRYQFNKTPEEASWAESRSKSNNAAKNPRKRRMQDPGL